MSSNYIVNSKIIKSVCVQTQLNSIYYIEIHVSTYLRSSLSSSVLTIFKDQL